MPVPRSSLILSSAPVRSLAAADLGVTEQQVKKEHGTNRVDDAPLAPNDETLLQVQRLLPRFGGVIFSGAPGTGKTYYAHKIGWALAEHDDKRIRFIQFHPSYQYEDFMQGFVPMKSHAGFTMKDKYFVEMARAAAEDPEHDYVVVIDELSRGDPGRVFGEALTYVDRTKRGLKFNLASGDTLTVPQNLVVLATMNPQDRGVDEVDAAFERRFAKIAMDPDVDALELFLAQNALPEPMQTRVVEFFRMVNGQATTTPQGAVGQAYFVDAVDEQSLRDIWEHQLRFVFEKAYRLDPPTLKQIREKWDKIFDAVPPSPEDEEATDGGASEDQEPDFDDQGD